MSVIPFDQPGLHPDAFLSEDFDQPDFATWEATLAGKGYETPGFFSGTKYVDNTHPFNSHNTFRRINGLGYGVDWRSDLQGSPASYYIVTMRTFLYFDGTVTPDSTYQADFSYPSGVQLNGDTGVDSEPFWVGAGRRGDSAVEAWEVEGGDGATFDHKYCAQPYAAISGEFIPVLTEGKITTTGEGQFLRQRMWRYDGQMVIDFTQFLEGIPDPGDPTISEAIFNDFWFYHRFRGTPNPEFCCGQYEFLPGEASTYFSGLGTSLACGLIPQWGGVTAFTHVIGGGTMKTSVDLGGQPKGGYKRWRPIGQKKYPKLPITIPPEPPIPDGGGLPAMLFVGPELTTIAAAAFTDTAIQLPAGKTILWVDTQVVDAIPGPTTGFAVGYVSDANKFQTANVGTTVGSTDPGTRSYGWFNSGAATPVRLGMIGGSPGAATGKVRVTIAYLD